MFVNSHGIGRSSTFLKYFQLKSCLKLELCYFSPLLHRILGDGDYSERRK